MITGKMVEACLEIVERIVQFGGGKLPRDHAAIVSLLLEKFASPELLRPDLRDRLTLAEWEEARSNFALGLVTALDIFARDRATQFLN